MNTLYATALGLIILAGSCASVAQQSTGAVAIQPHSPQPQVHMVFPAEESSSAPSIGNVPDPVFNAVFEPVHPPTPSHTFDKALLITNGLHLGMAILDVEMTQRCIADQRCQEGNPFMPSSRVGQLAVVSSLVAFDFGVSYQMKKCKMKTWWLAPSTGIMTHTLGVITGITHQ